MRARPASLLLLAAIHAAAHASGSHDASDARAGEVLIKLDPGVDAGTLKLPREIQARPLERLAGSAGNPLERWHRVVYRSEHAPATAAGLLSRLEGVQRAEPNLLATPTAIPDDTYAGGAGGWTEGAWGQAYPDLWGLASMQVELAWDVETGDPDLIVAVIDSGLDWNHDDLAGNVWINPGEVPDNGVDDDGNGYVDDDRGWSFAYGNNDVFDRFWHGTHQAGIIAARGNNAIGIPGVMWRARIMPVKAFDDNGAGAIADIAPAIVYAADNGAAVVHLGFSFRGQPSELLRDAVRHAHGLGAVLVAAAGNSGADTGDCNTGFAAPRAMSFPPCYRETIAVGAIDHLDARSEFSNFGAAIDLVAAGGDNADGSKDEEFKNILSLRASMPPLESHLTLDNDYFRNRGTSMSAAYVSGLAGLLRSRAPGASNERIRTALQASAVDLGQAGRDDESGFGRANAWQAIQELDAAAGVPELVLWSATADRIAVAPGTPLTVDVVVANAGDLAAGGASLELWDGEPGGTGTLLRAATLGAIPADGQVTLTAVLTLDLRGDHTLWAVVEPAAPADDRFAGNNRRKLDIGVYGDRFVESRITDQVGRQGDPDVSGERIVWEDYRDDPYHASIYMFDLTSGIESQVTFSAYDEQNPSFHGDLVAWHDLRPQDPPPGTWDVYYIDLRGGGEQRVTDIAQAELLPNVDNELIAWMDTRNGLGNSDIYAYDVQTGQESQITTAPGNQEDPAVDGSRIVWEDFRDGTPDVYVLDLETDVETALTADPCEQRLPEISGDHVVWEDLRHGNWDIYLHDLATGTEHRITSDPSDQTIPQIDAGRIVYQDYRVDGQSDIWMHEIATGDARRVTYHNAHQRWAKIDGRYIVWEDLRNADPATGASWDVYLATIDEFPQPPAGLTANASDDSVTLDWSASLETDVVAYGVFRAASADGDYLRVATTASPSYTDGALAPGTYFYRVTAIDAGQSTVDDQRGESPFSNEAGATVGAPAPGVSAGLSIVREPTGELTLSWAPDCGSGTAYGIYRGDLNAGYGSAAPEPGFCSVTTTAVTIPAGAGQADFFLVVPNDGTSEGGFGQAGGGPRTFPSATCLAQQAVDACGG